MQGPSSTRDQPFRGEAEADVANASAVPRASDASPLRLAVVAGKFPAFSETFISEMAARLVDRGHDVTIFASRHGSGPIHPEVERCNLVQRTRYRPRRSAVFKPPPTNGASRGVLGSVFRRPKLLSPLVFGAGTIALRQLFAATPWLGEAQRPPFHAAVCHFGPNAAEACRLRRAGVIHPSTAIIAIFHGIDAISISQRDIRELERHADAVYAVSHFLRNRVIERGMRDDRIGVQRMGTDLTRFPAAPYPARHAEDRFRLAFVGRLIEYKAVDVLLRAVATLPHDARDRVSLTVMGDGELRQSLQHLARELGVDGQVEFLGAVSQSIVRSQLCDAHALAVPSRTIPGQRFEGLGLVTTEAMSTGRPVIGAADGGIPEMVIHERTGLLVQPGDHADLAAAIERLVREPDFAQQLGAEARRFMLGEFDADSAIDTLVARSRDLHRARGARRSSVATV